MRNSSSDPRDSADRRNPSWRSILLSFGLLAVIPLALWVLPAPLTRVTLLGVAVGSIAGLVVGVRRAHALIRCFQDCRAMVFDVGDTVQITVSRSRACETC